MCRLVALGNRSFYFSLGAFRVLSYVWRRPCSHYHTTLCLAIVPHRPSTLPSALRFVAERLLQSKTAILRLLTQSLPNPLQERKQTYASLMVPAASTIMWVVRTPLPSRSFYFHSLIDVNLPVWYTFYTTAIRDVVLSRSYEVVILARSFNLEN